MIASDALRSTCCAWHAYTAASGEHAQCVVCDHPMPLVRASFAGLPAEFICPGCRITLAADLLRLEKKTGRAWPRQPLTQQPTNSDERRPHREQEHRPRSGP